jgi:hypothetical protein
MEWSYYLEEFRLGQPVERIVESLDELGDGEWEAVSAFPEPSKDPHGVFWVLFKKQKSK